MATPRKPRTKPVSPRSTRGSERAERNIDWIEANCLVPEGADVGKPVKLRPWQKDIIRGIYGTPTRQAIISFGRKNGKTALAAMLLLLHLCGPESKPNSQLYSAAQDQNQAAITYNLAVKMVRQSVDLSSAVTARETVKELLCPERGTLYKALSAEAGTKMGLSPIFAIHDELGQVRGPRSDLYTAIESGMAAHAQPMSIVISTQAATDADLLSVLIDDAKTAADPEIKLFLYTAGDSLEIDSDEALRAANPAFGDFQNEKELRKKAADAKRMPSQEAGFRNLNLNQRVEASSPFVS